MNTFQKEVKVETRIAIYQFTMYSVTEDKLIQSKRWGTEAGIESVRGQVLRESKRLVDASATRSDIPGLTEIGYNPPVEH